MKTKNKPVICLETLTAYINITQASEVTGCSREGINRVCINTQSSVRDSQGNKLTFRYARELIHDKGTEWFYDNVSLYTGNEINSLMEVKL